eukprot:jgi/Mesvir1/3936/Mv17841-RA.1
MSCVESKKQPSPDRASDGIELPAVTDVARQVSSSGARHRLAVSNVWRHLHAHFDRVLEECKEMHDGYGRGALLIRVHHLTQAARSVIVDWVTAGELREACLQTYWRAMMYNDQTEFVVAFCFADPADSRRKMWVSELMTKPKSDKWMEKNPEPAVPPFRTWTRVNASGEFSAPVCLGHYCGKKLTRGEERRLCVCKDAVFCSAVCSVTSHDAMFCGGRGPTWTSASRAPTPFTTVAAVCRLSGAPTSGRSLWETSL